MIIISYSFLKLPVTHSSVTFITLLSRVQITEDKEVAVVHIYRFEGEKIAEMWDISQEIPENSPNENGMF